MDNPELELLWLEQFQVPVKPSARLTSDEQHENLRLALRRRELLDGDQDAELLTEMSARKTKGNNQQDFFK